MASVISSVKATPQTFVVRIVGDGTAGTLVGTALVAALAEGPLKEAVVAKIAASACTDFNLDGAASGRVRARVVTGLNTTQVASVTSEIKWVSNGISATLDNNASVCVEFRFQHSIDR